MQIAKSLFLSLFILLSFHSISQTTIYTDDMDYVIGDVKQAFIQDKISTVAQIESLLTGFKTMKVNGIRVPIFPSNLEPNEPALKYFIKRANEEGFYIFANPAQGTGGKHLATGEFFSDISVKGDPVMTQNLINRVLEFDLNYPCKWINPFNEDARTNSVWSIDQMNTIYSSIKDGLVNAELIGSCAWGLPASIDIFTKTKIKDYITVSASHNLGFNHSSWTQFINLSHAAGLPVWDSEVNHNKKYENKSTRLEAAIQYGVDGLVLYDSWKAINLNTGVVSASGQNWMNLYLKPASIGEVKQSRPFADIFNVNKGFRIEFIESAKSHDVNIIDISGKRIRTYKVSDSELTVSNLPNGIYLVVMTANNQVQVEKVMVH